jgi:hypothetical protein
MKSLFTLLALIVGFAAMGQSDFDERLLVRFSEDYLNKLQQEQPEMLEYWTYYLDHGYTIVDGQLTGKTMTTEETVKIKDLNDINILDLDIQMDGKRPKAFLIKGTNQYLVLKGSRQFSKEFSRSRVGN